jgi:hypothetical protein
MKRSVSTFGIGTVADVRRPAIVVRGKTRLIVVFLSIFLVSYISLVMNTMPVVAQPERDAVFTSIEVTHGMGALDLINGGKAKIYYNQNPVYVNITLLNFNCSMASGSMFRLKVVSVPTGHSWESADIRVAEGNSSQIVYDLCKLYCGSCAQSGGTLVFESIWSSRENLSQPLVLTFRLYYYGITGRVFEEEKSITIAVVEEFVAFSQEQCKVEKGKTGSLEISVLNLDDEKIRDFNLTIGDSGVFELSPGMRELGDFAGSEKKTTSFDVKAPKATEIGTYNITVQVAYRDFSGVTHVESKTVSIAVEPELPPYLIIFSIATVAMAGTGGFLFFRMRRTAHGEKQAAKKT